MDLPHSRRSRFETLFPGGGGGGDDELPLEFTMDLRNLFESTAYWNPDIKIGNSGSTAIQFKLPDNITTYRIMAVASDMQSRAGSAAGKIISRKPLMIQPALPRFLYPDDEFTAEVLVFNSTGSTGRVSLTAEFSGVEMLDPVSVQTGSIPAGDNVSFGYRVRALEGKEAFFRFRATMGSESDGAEFTLPVLEPGIKQVEVTSQMVSRSSKLSMSRPAELIAGSASALLHIPSNL